jgi:hypothetical protein|tara:strand:- start:832 stop:1134 length:303 start_codon:yes stop_codon:yes gene_type:complete
MSEIEQPTDDDLFFDKDHIVFYTDETGDISIKFSIFDEELFQNLILNVLSGAINDPAINFLIKELEKQGLKEEALNLLIVKKLLNQEENSVPIVKPSNFR